MGIFDNVTSVTINNKEVASIEVDGGSIYTKSGGESRDITFKLMNGDEPLPYPDVPITVDDVTENTDENGEVVFNLEDGSHTVKVIERTDEGCQTEYEQVHVTDASSTQQQMDVSPTKTIELEFVDKDTKEVIEDINYWVSMIDTNCNKILLESNYHTEESIDDQLRVSFTFKAYANEEKSELLGEVTVDSNDTKATIEVPSPPSYEVDLTVLQYDSTPYPNRDIEVYDSSTSEVVAEATTDNNGECTVNLKGGSYYLSVYDDDHYGVIGSGEIEVDSEHTSFTITCDEPSVTTQ